MLSQIRADLEEMEQIEHQFPLLTEILSILALIYYQRFLYDFYIHGLQSKGFCSSYGRVFGPIRIVAEALNKVV